MIRCLKPLGARNCNGAALYGDMREVLVVLLKAYGCVTKTGFALHCTLDGDRGFYFPPLSAQIPGLWSLIGLFLFMGSITVVGLHKDVVLNCEFREPRQFRGLQFFHSRTAVAYCVALVRHNHPFHEA